MRGTQVQPFVGGGSPTIGIAVSVADPSFDAEIGRIALFFDQLATQRLEHGLGLAAWVS